MLTLPGLLLVVLLAGAAAWVMTGVLRAYRRCPMCREPFVTVPDADQGRTYEVVACLGCGTADTLVRGRRGVPATCPSCRQRGLRTAATRLPDRAGVGRGLHAVRVEVDETCVLCQHRALRRCGGQHSHRRGQVVDFPGQE